MMKLTVISDNNALHPFENEHGFSILIEYESKKVLFDTGRSEAFIHNLKKLNIDPSDLDKLIISHGHNDHCGNIEYIVKNSPNIEVIIHPESVRRRYSIHPEREPAVKMIGIDDYSRDILLRAKLNQIISNLKVDESLNITGEIPRISGEDCGGPFFLDSNGTIPDLIIDDQSIWFDTSEGLVIITGCCHSGLQNSIEYIKKVSGREKVKAIIGGLHLSKASDKRVQDSITYLNKISPASIFPGHCTGNNIIDIFKRELTFTVEPLYAGKVITINR